MIITNASVGVNTVSKCEQVQVKIVKRYTMWLDGMKVAVVERSNSDVTYSIVGR